LEYQEKTADLSQVDFYSASSLKQLSAERHVVILVHIILYKLDTLLLKQKKLPVLDITGFFFKIGICCFSAKHAALRTKTAVGSEQDNVYEYDDMSNLYNNIVVEKTNGMTFNPTTTLN
jgi:hypothetical protein